MNFSPIDPRDPSCEICFEKLLAIFLLFLILHKLV